MGIKPHRVPKMACSNVVTQFFVTLYEPMYAIVCFVENLRRMTQRHGRNRKTGRGIRSAEP